MIFRKRSRLTQKSCLSIYPTARRVRSVHRVRYPLPQRLLKKKQPTGHSKETLSLSGNMESQRHGSVATKPVRELEIKWLWTLHSSSSKCKPYFIFLTGFLTRANDFDFDEVQLMNFSFKPSCHFSPEK